MKLKALFLTLIFICMSRDIQAEDNFFPCLSDKDFIIEISYQTDVFCGGTGDTRWYAIMESGYNPIGAHSGDESVSFKMEYYLGYMFFCRDENETYHIFRIHLPPPIMPDSKVFRVERKGNRLLMSLNGKLMAEYLIDFSIRCNKKYPLKVGTITTNAVSFTTQMLVKSLIILSTN